MRDLIINIADRCPPIKSRVKLWLGIGQPERKCSMPVAITITNEQKVNVTLTPTTDTGKPAKLDGKPEWEIVSGTSTLAVADDGLSAYLISSDDPGDTEVLVKADANLGAGPENVETISEMIKLTVSGSMAKNLGLVVGQPEPK